MTLAYGDLDPTRALPAASYRDPAWLAAETDRIWHGDWVFVTTEDALSTPGDQLPVVVGNQPVLVLRNQSGELAAVSNLCAHRGTLLVEEPTNNKRIQCPYHAWTYDDGGRLLAVPFAQAGAVDRSSHCLPAYRVESWHGLVFVSLDRNVEPLGPCVGDTRVRRPTACRRCRTRHVRKAAVASARCRNGAREIAH